MFYSQALSDTAVLAAAFLPAVLAQTSTECNPLQKTCPSNPGLNSATLNTDFTQGHDGWSISNPGVTYSSNGAVFTITGDGQAPTLQTDKYILFGRVDVTLQASPGTGIVSSIVLLSEVLDEIDWEFLGSVPGTVQTNFFGKGDTSSYDRVTYVPTANTQASFHTYSIDWTAERIQWLVDGAVVRTLAYNDAVAAGGRLYPQTPSRVKLGNWVAGGANNAPGTVQWAGGKSDFSQAPFVMTVKSVSITNYSPADSYTYSDNSGSWQSVKLSGGPSNPPPKYSSSITAAAPSTSTTTTAARVSTTSSSVPAPPPAWSKSVESKLSTTTIPTSAGRTSTSPAAVVVQPTTSTVFAVGTGTRAPSGSISTAISSSSTNSAAQATYTGSACSLRAGAAGSLLGLAAAAAFAL